MMNSVVILLVISSLCIISANTVEESSSKNSVDMTGLLTKEVCESDTNCFSEDDYCVTDSLGIKRCLCGCAKKQSDKKNY